MLSKSKNQLFLLSVVFVVLEVFNHCFWRWGGGGGMKNILCSLEKSHCMWGTATLSCQFLGVMALILLIMLLFVSS